METTRVQLMELREARNIRENIGTGFINAELMSNSTSPYSSKLYFSTRFCARR